MSEPTSPSQDAGVATRDALAGAARASIEADLSLEDFMSAAWAAYADARPGLRAWLEDQQILARFAELRERGQVGAA